MIVEVFVVALNESYDFQIDSRLKVWEVAEMIAQLVRQILREPVRNYEIFQLSSQKLNCILEEERLVCEYDIKEGDKLFLF